MLLKLLKYEFKATGLRLLTAYAVYAVVVGALLLFPVDTGADSYLQTLQVWRAFLIALCMFALFIVLFITLFQRYHANLYGSEGYLMFTLPVSARKLLLSKLTAAFVWVVSYCAVFSITVLLIAVRYGDAVSVNRIAFSAWAARGEIPPLLTYAIVYICFIAMSIYFAITVAKLPLWRGAGVVMGIAAFFALHLLLNIPAEMFQQAVYHYSVSPGFELLFMRNAVSAQASHTLVWISNGYTLLLCVGLFFATSSLMARHTSLK